MAMTDGNDVFVDTNVLTHATVAQSPLFKTAQKKVSQLKREGRELWISRQILREYLAALGRPQSLLSSNKPIPPSTLVAEVNHLQTQYRVAEDNQIVTDELLVLITKYAVGGKQIHDANIVATMIAY